MTITYKLEPLDLRAFQRYAYKNLPGGRRTRHVMNASIVIASLLLTFSSDDHRPGFRITYFLLLLLVFWVFMRLWMFGAMRLVQWRAYTSEKFKSVLCEHTVTLENDSLIETTQFNQARHLWPGIYRITDTPDYIYVFVSANMAHMIPKRAFPDQETARRFYEKALSLKTAAQPIAA